MHSFKLTPLLLLALNSMVKAADEDTTSYETTVTVTSTPQVVQTTTVPGEVLINGIVYVWTDANGQLTSTTEYETTTVPITTDAQQTSSDAETDSDSDSDSATATATAAATTDGNESTDAAAPSSQPSVPAESSDAATSSADATAAPSSDAQESQSTVSVSNSESAPTQAPTTTAPASSEATSSASSGDDAGEEEEDNDDDDATRSLTLAPNVSSIFVNVPAGDYSTSTITTDTTLSDGRTAALELVVLYTAVCSAN